RVRTCLCLPRCPTAPLFPYTTLFRSPPPRQGLTESVLQCFGDPDERRRAGPAVEELVRAADRHVRARTGEIDRQGTGRMISPVRSEEHTSELQSRFDLVCRLLLEKKK